MIADIYLEGDKQLKVAVVIEMEEKMERLKNKNILITGGTSGIGLASAQEFEREGARVVICGTDEKRLKDARSTLGPIGLTLNNAMIRAKKEGGPIAGCSPAISLTILEYHQSYR